MVHATIADSEIVRLVAREYDVGTPTRLRLLSGGINNTYEVGIEKRRYVLRLHPPGKWWIYGESDMHFELNLLIYLNEQGVPVSSPLPRKTGDPLGRFHFDAREYFYSLFTWASGNIVGTDMMTKEQAYLVGHTLAIIHQASDGYKTDNQRYTLNEWALLDRPLKQLESSLQKATHSEVEFITEQVEQIRTRLRAFEPGTGEWGIIHGDVQALNYHITTNGQITFFDFDLCGYGWRGYDLAYYYTRIPKPLRTSVLEGYHAVRPISNAEYDMLPTFGRLAWIHEGTMMGDGLPVIELIKLLHNPYL